MRHKSGLVAVLALLFMTFIVIPLTAQDTDGQTYTVRTGDSLNRIATLYNITVADLTMANPDLTNSNLIYPGQVLNIPVPAQTAPAVENAPESAVEAVETPPPGSNAHPQFAYGVEASFPGQDVTTLSNHLSSLGLHWVKHEVRWRDFESEQGVIDFETLDSIITALEAQNVNILLTVTTAPAWARSLQEENGPPDNFARYGEFVRALAARYEGRVDAYEIWDEPNLRSRWKSQVHTIGAQSYLELLRHGYDAVKSSDPAALVISAGLAPTGYNDAYNAELGNLEINAVDDRVFLNELYAAGLADYSDGIGIHPIGWANPPDALCCTPAEDVATHYEVPYFYFLETLNHYHNVMLANNDGEKALWVTKFGWGTSEDLGGQADPMNIFVSYTSLEEQSAYAPRAFEIGAELGFVGPMFLYNLNGCQAMDVYGAEGCYYSLLGPEGSFRPVGQALQSLDKITPVTPVEDVSTPSDSEDNPTPEIETTPILGSPEGEATEEPAFIPGAEATEEAVG